MRVEADQHTDLMINRAGWLRIERGLFQNEQWVAKSLSLRLP
jgi:hypothetical protein